MRTDVTAVISNEPKVLCPNKAEGSNQKKVSGPEPGFADARPQTVWSPVESQGLNRPQGKCVERGKPIVLPLGESEP